jgi:undecaprenyl-diphosphatase
MEEYLKAAVLGLIQGIAEFLPISSSGHLIILGNFFFGSSASQVSEVPLDLNIALHVGTLVSILAVFYKQIWQAMTQPRLMLAVVIATIPAGVIGVLLKHDIEHFLSDSFRACFFAACGLFVTAFFLLFSQVLQSRKPKPDDLSPIVPQHEPMHVTPKQALLVGCFQAVAIAPGISRSGSTISGGLMLGIPRDQVGVFSFLMAIPVLGGAALLECKDLIKGEAHLSTPMDAMLLGMVVSAIVGWFSLVALLQMIKRGKLHYFAYYCIGMGTLTLIWLMLKSAATTSPLS